tara:strand:- start:608 stop:793 length:186 start_codon:yes stop_codon:yes gene_type:complete
VKRIGICVNGVNLISLEIIMQQDKIEIILWEIYNNVRQLNDSDLEKAKAIINQEINDRRRK